MQSDINTYYKALITKVEIIFQIHIVFLLNSYGLLGPSGCGKTTLLGCIANRLKLSHGEIHIFGYKPGTSEAAVPGHRVGYMPQVSIKFAV